MVKQLGGCVQWLTDPSTWEAVDDAIGPHAYEYDFDDGSERLDAIQIVCEALAKIQQGRPS